MRMFDRDPRLESEEALEVIHPEPRSTEREVRLMGNWVTGQACLECERPECMVNGNWWVEDLPWHATLDEARRAFERHLKTHER